MRICLNCRDTEDQQNPGLVTSDAGSPGGQGPCGDHHRFVPAEKVWVPCSAGADGAKKCPHCHGSKSDPECPDSDCPCCGGHGYHRQEIRPAVRIIVSRHPAAVAFIRMMRPEFRTAPVFAEANPDDVRGRTVAGNLPLHLACLASSVLAVEFSGHPPRGREYDQHDMLRAGARIIEYVVRQA